MSPKILLKVILPSFLLDSLISHLDHIHAPTLALPAVLPADVTVYCCWRHCLLLLTSLYCGRHSPADVVIYYFATDVVIYYFATDVVIYYIAMTSMSPIANIIIISWFCLCLLLTSLFPSGGNIFFRACFFFFVTSLISSPHDVTASIPPYPSFVFLFPLVQSTIPRESLPLNPIKIVTWYCSVFDEVMRLFCCVVIKMTDGLDTSRRSYCL